MHTGKSYKFSEFLVWTKRNIYVLVTWSSIAVVLYKVGGFSWLAVPWPVVALLGTATAFIVGFKNTQSYNRTMDAQQVWISIVTSSRVWGTMSRDFLHDPAATRELIYRHFAWLNALRYQVRQPRTWETISKIYNVAYNRFYCVPERDVPLQEVLAPYLPKNEIEPVLASSNPASYILSLQSASIKSLYEKKEILINFYIEFGKMISGMYDQQGRSERIKNFPYPRQYSIINRFFIRLFCFLLPFGMLTEFDGLNQLVHGFMKGNMVWLVIPFSVIISWMYTSLEQVGESSENPFEGSANDVPISHLSRNIEIELREMLGETDLPPVLEVKNNIML
ncbi:MAG: bestrophin family ion channel [Ferruginibacter sp.]|nr:bestrophin family ion channel [Ferruginibacter sp.]